MNEPLNLKKGQGMAYYQFGDKELITEKELDEYKKSDHIRKIYFCFTEGKISRVR